MKNYKLWSCCKSWAKCSNERVIHESTDIVDICYMMDKHTMTLDRDGHYKISADDEVIASGDAYSVKDELMDLYDVKFRDIGMELESSMKNRLNERILSGKNYSIGLSGMFGKWYKGDIRSGNPYPIGWSAIDNMGSNTVLFELEEQLHPKFIIIRTITYVCMTDVEMESNGSNIEIPINWINNRNSYPRFGISDHIIGIENGKLQIVSD